MKVVLFGDSLLAKFHKDHMRDIESQVRDSDVYNCAMGGWNSDDGVAKAPYIASLKPDAVIISLGTNDAAPWKIVPLDRFRSNIHDILRIFTDSDIIFLLPPPINETKDTEGERRTNVLMKEYADAAKEVCMNAGSVKLIDSWTIFSPMLESGSDYHTEDGVHLTDSENSILITHLTVALTTL